MSTRRGRFSLIIHLFFYIYVMCCCLSCKPETPRADVGTEAPPVELTIAVLEGGFGRPYWDAVAAAFEEDNPGITVTVRSNPKIADIIRPNLVSGRSVPDFIYIPAGSPSGIYQQLAGEHALVELTDVFDLPYSPDTGADFSDASRGPEKRETLRERLIPGTLDAATTAPYGDGKIYAAPINYSPLGLWYNRTLFARKGWGVPSSWDEFIELGRKAAAEGIALFAYPGQYPGYLEGVFPPAIAAAGGPQVMDAVYAYRENAWRHPAVRKVFDAFADLAHAGYVLPGCDAMSHIEVQRQLLLDKVLFIPCGSWIEEEMVGVPRSDGFEFGFAPVPQFSTPSLVTIYLEEMYIPRNAEHQDIAKRFLAYQYSAKAVNLYARLAKAVSPVADSVEIASPFLDAASLAAFRIFDDDHTAWTLGMFAPSLSDINIAQNVFYGSYSSVIHKTLTVDQWIENLEDTARLIRSAADSGSSGSDSAA